MASDQLYNFAKYVEIVSLWVRIYTVWQQLSASDIAKHAISNDKYTQ